MHEHDACSVSPCRTTIKLGTDFLSGYSSEVMQRTIDIELLSTPSTNCHPIADAKVREKPNPSIPTAQARSPVIRTSFLPHDEESAILPQITPVQT